LARAQCLERDDEVRISCTRNLRNFLDLALTEQRGRIDAGTPLHCARNNHRTRRAGQGVELVHFDLEKSVIFAGVNAR